MQVNWSFNANQYEPNQGMGIHPPAQKVPFTITNTAIVETKDKTGGMLVVDFTSPMGMIVQRYNINNQNAKAVEIAYGQLSALCRATGVLQIDGQNECAALRGAKGLMDVGYQKGEEPDPAHPERKGYTELKKVYDVNGNDPSRAGVAPQQAQPQGQPQPLQQQGNGSWGAQPAPQPQPSQAPPQAQQPAPQQGQAWQPGGAQAGATPPWGPRT
jgi:hypothetical protein